MLLSKMKSVVSLVVLSAIAPLAHATSIVTNGTFANGLDGWTESMWFSGGSSLYAADGCGISVCLAGGSNPAYLAQNLPTIAGDTYTLSFDFRDNGNPGELQVFFGGKMVGDIVNGPTSLTLFTLSGLAPAGASTALEFFGYDGPGFLVLKNVSVVDDGPATSPVPEPTTLAMVGSGLLGLAGVARRRFC